MRRGLLQVLRVQSSLTASGCRFNSSEALVYNTYGPPGKVLDLQRSHLRQLLPNEVRVSILASTINPSDFNTIEGVYPIQPPLPAVPGNEGVGEVVALGEQVRGLKKGDWVVPLKAGMGWWRSAAHFCAGDLHRVPQDIGLTAAASLSINPPTALRLLQDYVDLSPGDVVIQNGATSSVGQMVMQLAAEKGLQTVNVIRRSPQRVSDEELKSLGATLVTDEDNLKADMSAAGLPAASLALNCVGGSASLAIAKRLRQSGTMVTYGGMSKQPVMAPTPAFIFKDLRLRGFWLSGNRSESDKKETAAVLDHIVQLYLQQKIKATRRISLGLHEWRHMSSKEGSKLMFQPHRQ
ncbi:hypothetical protein WJX74_008913 [Apatococcus lobatus]|uniref:enoyl-[acyl-carrier-protein] reductase n=1 Tax=Apatococcus lobatus TaxID=904363 RepID=A0AAW1RV30_9CHLO